MPGTYAKTPSRISPDIRKGLLPAAHRRHRDLVATAGAAVDFLAGAELQVLAEADPHFAEPRAVAGHRDRRTAEAGVDLDEGLLDGRGRHRRGVHRFKVSRRDLHRRPRLADGLEIGARREPRAGAVLVPLTEDQSGRR